MIGAEGGTAAGRVAVLVTDGGAHPATKWAMATAEGIVSIDSDMEPAKKQLAFNLRRDIAKTLRASFEEVRSDCTMDQIETLTVQAWSRIADLAQPTPWAIWFNDAAIADQMKVVIRRNLFSAAEIALELE